MIDFEAIRKRADAATPGPWEKCRPSGEYVHNPATGFNVCMTRRAYDSEFIAHAREDIPYLLSQLAKYDEVAAEYGIDGKTMLTLAKSQIKTAQDNIKLQEQLTASQRRADAAVEQLRLYAGCNVCNHREGTGCALGGCYHAMADGIDKFEWVGPQEAGGRSREMSRLTEFRDGIWGLSVDAVREGYDRYSVFSRLAAYEDTGYRPEDIVFFNKCFSVLGMMPHDSRDESIDHLRDLLIAEDDGRVVVLPCKVGDTMYWADNEIYAAPVSCTVTGFKFIAGVSGGWWINAKYTSDVRQEDYRDFRASSFGKTVFFTPEEAEAALKGGTA